MKLHVFYSLHKTIRELPLFFRRFCYFQPLFRGIRERYLFVHMKFCNSITLLGQTWKLWLYWLSIDTPGTAWKVSVIGSFWSVFSRIRTEYGEIHCISPYLIWMRENTDQKNSEYGGFSRSDTVICFSSCKKAKPNDKHFFRSNWFPELCCLLL